MASGNIFPFRAISMPDVDYAFLPSWVLETTGSIRRKERADPEYVAGPLR